MSTALRSRAARRIICRMATGILLVVGTFVASGGARAGSGGSLVAPGFQVAPTGGPTIMVTSTGLATAPAEVARIQFLIGITLDLSATTTGTTTTATVMPRADRDDVAPVIRAIVAAGAEPDAIAVIISAGLSGYFSPGSASALIEVLVEQPTPESVATIIEAGVAAATNPLMLQQVGVEYDLADCEPLIDQARKNAIAAARDEAREIAEALGGTVGELVQVAAYGSYVPSIDPDDTGCPPPFAYGYGYYGPGSPFDTPLFNPAAPAEVVATVQLTLTVAFVPATS